jgi:carboxymethylenebutenolidase
MIKKIIFIFVLVIVSLNNSKAQNAEQMVVANSGNPSVRGNGLYKDGEFITIRGVNGFNSRVYAAGPENARAGILIVHDFFGITPSTKETVDRLGDLGYRTIAVDLYQGRFAHANDSAQILMQGKVRTETDHILKEAIEYLKRPGRKLATIGFSAGGIDAVNASLVDSESVNATVLIYAGDYDKIEKSKIEKLNSPILAITGSMDNWAVESAFNFLRQEKSKSFELYIYPGADHGYAQPYFLNGKNYDKEAIRMTWKLMEDFLSRHLKN